MSYSKIDYYYYYYYYFSNKKCSIIKKKRNERKTLVFCIQIEFYLRYGSSHLA